MYRSITHVLLTLLLSLFLVGNAAAIGFTLGSSYPVGAAPAAVAIGDFNRDGKRDLAVANSGDGTISILLGNGDGTFQQATTFAVGVSLRAIAAKDLNHDGKLDLAVADFGDGVTPGTGGVHVLLGNGDGTFQAPRSVVLDAFPVAVAVGSLNDDGKPDLVVGQAGGTGDAHVTVLLGNGDGTFRSPSNYAISATSHNPRSVIVADVNSDDNQDVVVADGAMTFLFGNGDGTLRPAVFENPICSGTSCTTRGLALGDFNMDGTLDFFSDLKRLVTFKRVIFGQLVTFGAVEGSPYFFPPSSTPYPAALDFDDDGKLDLAFLSGGPDFSLVPRLTLMLGNGDGTLKAPLFFAAGSPHAIFGLAADLNRDGRPDVVVLDAVANTLTVLLNTP